MPPVGNGQQNAKIRAKVSLMRKMIEFGREVEREVKKIAWPSRKEIGVTTLMIFIMGAIASVFFFFVDWGIGKLIRLVLNVH
jgi:preprotein translocase subunit SecE